ncbi:MAG: glutamate synthase subunit beta [Planctomycetaceae bacterium]|nr:MAG: glutamate synthase subunit beta [Planctomycetaceae bacterium]
MGKPSGFMEFQRETPTRRDVAKRLNDYQEVYQPFPELKLIEQGARCMDCGVPFCHTGCPLGNLIPDWNDLVYRENWQEAIRRLHATNNFPEFTGRLCPAPCEEACVLGINEPPVTIKNIENSIIEKAFAEGWVVPEPPAVRTGKKVAVIGSGPAGLAAAQQLNRAGHWVTVYERADRIGGLLRYGIPEFKMEKRVVDRRLEIMEAEGIVFRPGVNVGVDITGDQLRRDYDVVLLALGATIPRDLPVPGRELKGIYYAMEFLPLQNRKCEGDLVDDREFISAQGKNVVIIGGGDTGADCLGTVHRQGCKQVVQLELLPKPPKARDESMPWPYWPTVLRTSSAHEEGGVRDWSVGTKKFTGSNGQVEKLHAVRLNWVNDGGRMQMQEVAGSDFTLDADLVLLAMGFLGPQKQGIVEQLGVELDPRSNVKADDNYMTSVPGVFSAGDVRRGQSLIVWAIWEGREAAVGVDKYLMGSSELPSSPQLLGRDARPGV